LGAELGIVLTLTIFILCIKTLFCGFMPVICRLQTRPRTDVNPQEFLDQWTDSGSLFPGKLRMWTDADTIP